MQRPLCQPTQGDCRVFRRVSKLDYHSSIALFGSRMPNGYQSRIQGSSLIFYTQSHIGAVNVISYFFRFKFFVYSAYYDDRVGGTSGSSSHGLVRIIGATKTRAPERVWCRLWYRQINPGNATASVTVAAKVKVRVKICALALSLVKVSLASCVTDVSTDNNRD